MTDQQFLASFRDQSLPEVEFNHLGHIRMAWLYLEENPLLEALRDFRNDLIAYASALGASNKYSETITWFYMMLINQRRSQGKANTWQEFIAANPDLIRKEDPILSQFYSKDLLSTRFARKNPCLPDLHVHREEKR